MDRGFVCLRDGVMLNVEIWAFGTWTMKFQCCLGLLCLCSVLFEEPFDVGCRGKGKSNWLVLCPKMVAKSSSPVTAGGQCVDPPVTPPRVV